MNSFEHRKDGVLLDVGTGWAKPYYDKPDILAMTEWDEAIYKGTEMRRRILWADRYWIDLFTVEGTAPEHSIDYTLHLSGDRLTKLPQEQPSGPINDQKPQCYLSDVTKTEPGAKQQEGQTVKGVPVLFDCGGVTAAVYTFQNDNTLFFAQGPDNPGVTMLSYLVERQTGGSAMFLTLTETYQEEGPLVKEVAARMENGQMIIEVTTVDGEVRVHKIAL